MNDFSIDYKMAIHSMLQYILQEHPELRYAQIIFIAAQYGEWNDNDVFYCPDDILYRGLKQFISSDTFKLSNPP